jgi:hypothetical protein
MRDAGVFSLVVHHTLPSGPRVGIALNQYATDWAGRILLAADCDSLVEFEGRINAIQDDLDQLRKHARRVFRAATNDVG